MPIRPTFRATPALSDVERFRTHRWVRRIQLTQRMRLPQHELALRETGAPRRWREHLAGGPAGLRTGLLEALPPELLAQEVWPLLTLWKEWDQETWGQALNKLAEGAPQPVSTRVAETLAQTGGLPRGPAVPWMLAALVQAGPAGLPVAWDWAKAVRTSGVPLEYLWGGFFGAMAQMAAPGLPSMVVHAFQAFPPGSREVDTVLEDLFRSLAPGNLCWEMVHGMRRGAGYLMEDFPELFHQSTPARKLDGLLIEPGPIDLGSVAELLPTNGRWPKLTSLAAEMVKLASAGRCSVHADRIGTFAMAAACTSCLREQPGVEASSVPELLGLLTADLCQIPGQESLIEAIVARFETRHQPVLEKEMDQIGTSAGLSRLVTLLRRLGSPAHIPWLVSLLRRQTASEAAWNAAGALVEQGDRVLPELERTYDSLDFEGRGRCLDVMGFFDSAEVGAALSRRLRSALADTELLDRWALAASYVGHQDLIASARRWASSAPWPLQALADIEEL